MSKKIHYLADAVDDVQDQLTGGCFSVVAGAALVIVLVFLYNLFYE